MTWRRLIVALIIAELVLTSTAITHADFGNEPTYKIVGYFTSWSIYARHFFVTDIAADKLTYINYAFIKVSNDGECISGDEWADTQYLYPGDPPDSSLHGNFRQLKLLKASHPQLKILMSVGGWTWSDRFSDVALTVQSRERFARSCVSFMERYGFDGIDLDWEFPVSGGLSKGSGRPEDRENFTLLLAEFRRQLDALEQTDGVHRLLTIAAPATQQFYQNLELDRLSTYLDWLNLMAYSFHGGWSAITNLHAPLYASSSDSSPDEAMRHDFNADAAVRAYLGAGVPAEKIVLGVPFYGQGWQGVPDQNNGLYQPFKGLPKGTWGDGIYDYKDIAAHYLTRYRRFWQPEAQVPWLYDSASGIMISYEDPQSLRIKANYTREQRLGGVMIWELDYDDRAHTLLTTLYDALVH